LISAGEFAGELGEDGCASCQTPLRAGGQQPEIVRRRRAVDGKAGDGQAMKLTFSTGSLISSCAQAALPNRSTWATLEREKTWRIFPEERPFCATPLGWSKGTLPPGGSISCNNSPLREFIWVARPP
jgi:hypothetical protein